MKLKQLLVIGSIVVVAVLLLVLVSGSALAQKPGPSSEDQVAPLPGSAGGAVVVQPAGPSVPSLASEDSQPRAFPMPEGLQPDDNPPSR
jgi:streptogramin lyase